jgi:dCMP deaminase
MSRKSWDEYFMAIAELVAERSTCLRRQVGAVIVKDRKILSTGYNGAPRGIKHCSEVGCVRKQLNIPPGERHEICREYIPRISPVLSARKCSSTPRYQK